MILGLIRERKTPPDTRVPLTPLQCRELLQAYPDLRILVEPSPDRCYGDEEYAAQGIELSEDLSECDILLGVKEVPVSKLMPGKTYFFFSHTRKKQSYNKPLAQALVRNNIRMIDYETLTYPDGQRILGFGFFAGVVGSHNGLLTYGKKFGLFELSPAHELGTLEQLREAYKALKLPPVKLIITGSGKVAAGALEVMQMLDIEYVEPCDLEEDCPYPVYTHLKGQTLYAPINGDNYHREHFHKHPQEYRSLFAPYLTKADILLNGVYWDDNIPRLFEPEQVSMPHFRCAVMADITCDVEGSVSINSGSSTIADPVYALDRFTLAPAPAFQPTTDVIDVMAVDNLPNELPRDASEYFGAHLIKYIIPELLSPEKSDLLFRATMCIDGRLTPHFAYLSDYAY